MVWVRGGFPLKMAKTLVYSCLFAIDLILLMICIRQAVQNQCLGLHRNMIKTI